MMYIQLENRYLMSRFLRRFCRQQEIFLVLFSLKSIVTPVAQSYRRSGSAIEITDLTIDTYGFVKGDLNEIELAGDPTNGEAYDDLSQVLYTTFIPMDAGAARLVAEITATTAVDLDIFWGFDINGDGLPSADEQYEASATGTAFEYLRLGLAIPFYDDCGSWFRTGKVLVLRH